MLSIIQHRLVSYIKNRCQIFDFFLKAKALSWCSLLIEKAKKKKHPKKDHANHIIPEESGNPKICHCPHSKFGHRAGSYSTDGTWINRLTTSCERSKAKEYNLYLVI